MTENEWIGKFTGWQSDLLETSFETTWAKAKIKKRTQMQWVKLLISTTTLLILAISDCE